jgi:hypothetical protein
MLPLVLFLAMQSRVEKPVEVIEVDPKVKLTAFSPYGQVLMVCHDGVSDKEGNVIGVRDCHITKGHTLDEVINAIERFPRH